ncbi:site-specific DNA-methyltransferase [Leptotrichia sp. oral taxon 879]|uniref:site-specific DNA-methyltransferase n=1 Tax=Leptotrichia sp. oral taxon 879 TaxID=1227267 RepID=UPI0003ADD881|nr:site-specific DNA-methyltransferase [Leptotrichia sp. oral taxon 879]ERK55388.1 DNA (cytosine-5-)-methyltransferase [Leptotrichia sp. oral taxon 879 str. F0557]
MENNKIKKEINDVVNDNLKALEQLFPSAVKDGQLDIKALKEELGDFEEVTTEKYELNWAGKQNAKKIVQQGIGNKTLKFVEKDSKNADTTENIYIEGDNLEVLKLLRQNYYNSIKMIYIDPPYNTGNDFVYNDTFKMDKEESDKAEGIISENNEKLQKNQKSTNRYHANWLNMMYPRLKLARDLLTDDGVIFISIDDNEQANLKRLCDEIFGEENFVGSAGRITKKSNNKGDFWAPNFDYLITYTKNRQIAKGFTGGANTRAYNLIEEEGERKGEKYQLVRLYMSSIQNRNSEQRYWIDCPDGTKVIPPGTTFPPERPNLGDGIWRWSRKTFEENKDRIVIKKVNSSNLIDENGNPAKWNVFTKTYLSDVMNKATAKPNDFIENYINQIASHELRNLEIPFDYAKPSLFIKYLMEISRIKEDDIILDFFSGSATTAHAVMQLNSEDNGNRKYIMVQLPETTDEKSEAFKAGYKNIAEIGKERIRRAGEKIKQEIEEYNLNLKLGEEPKKVPDIGFKVFKVDNTNIKWYDLENFNGESQYSFDDPDSLDFVLGSNDIDIVYEIMLRQNDIPLSESLEVLTDIGNRTYLYASTYLICLETEITEEMVEKLASLEPLPIKFVFRDSAFKDNISLKDETFRKLRSLIERNSGESKVSYRVEFI